MISMTASKQFLLNCRFTLICMVFLLVGEACSLQRACPLVADPGKPHRYVEEKGKSNTLADQHVRDWVGALPVFLGRDED